MSAGEYFVLVTEWQPGDVDVIVYPYRNGMPLFNCRVTVAGDARATARDRLCEIGWDVAGEWSEAGSAWRADVRRS